MLPVRNREKPTSLFPPAKATDLQSLLLIAKKFNVDIKTLLTLVMAKKMSP